MSDSIEEQIIKNVQGQFAIYKTTEVVGVKAQIPNLEWEETDQIDKFFMFAKNLGVKIIYITEGEEEDEQGAPKSTILQVGFLHQGIMHHINFVDEDDEDENEYEDEDEYDEDVENEPEVEPTPNSPLSQPSPQPAPQPTPQQNSGFIGSGFQ